MQLHAMTRGLRAIAARSHVAPPSAPILGFVLEHTSTPRVCAASDAHQLAEDERVGGAFDDGNEETGERVTDGDEGAHEGAVVRKLQPPRASAAAEYAIDLGEGIAADVVRDNAALGERPKDGPYAPRVAEDRECSRGLLVRAATHARRAFRVEQMGALEPAHEALEVVQAIDSTRRGLRVYEVEPQPFGDEGERVPIAFVEVHR